MLREYDQALAERKNDAAAIKQVSAARQAPESAANALRKILVQLDVSEIEIELLRFQLQVDAIAEGAAGDRDEIRARLVELESLSTSVDAEAARIQRMDGAAAEVRQRLFATVNEIKTQIPYAKNELQLMEEEALHANASKLVAGTRILEAAMKQQATRVERESPPLRKYRIDIEEVKIRAAQLREEADRIEAESEAASEVEALVKPSKRTKPS